jgi:hypothetical protein
MFGNFAKIGPAAVSMTKLDTSQCQHILSQSPVLPDIQPKFGAFVRIFI